MLLTHTLSAGQQTPPQGQIPQAQINVTLDDGDGKVPPIRRTDPRDEPVLVKIVERRSPGVTDALFSLGYLKDPAPRTRDVLREAAVSPQVAIAYPAICSLWRTDDPKWRSLANTALPKLTRTQQLHIARLLFQDGDYARWHMISGQLLDLLAAPDDPGGHLKSDVYGMLNAAWQMTDASGSPGAALRDLREQMATRPAPERARIAKSLDSFTPNTLIQ